MLNVGKKEDFPIGFKLRHTLHAHEEINRIAWSPDGKTLACGSKSETIQIWDVKKQEVQHLSGGNFNFSVAWSPNGEALAIAGKYRIRLWNMETKQSKNLRTKPTKSVAWSRDGKILASGSDDGIIRLWDIESEQILRTLTGHSLEVNSVVWSPDGKLLASGAADNSVRIWDVESGQTVLTFTTHTLEVNCVAWSSDGEMLASASSDKTVQLWNAKTGLLIGSLDGHVKPVISIAFSFDSRLLASKSLDGTVQLWNLQSLERIAVLEEPSLPYGRYAGLAFHPNAHILATLGEEDRVIRVWNLDLVTLLGDISLVSSIPYRSAKVVLVGDSNVGKSGLSLVLTGRRFKATESTHGLVVWPFDNKEEEFESELIEIHETFLWDLAGQPSYRLIHQLHLNNVSVALVVFDACNPIDSTIAVHYWDRTLRLIQRIQNTEAFPLKKFLVVARIDMRRSFSESRIESLVDELNFDDSFLTSAKERREITELAESIKSVIDWDVLPKASSTDIFHLIKEFLLQQKKAGQIISTVTELHYKFLEANTAFSQTNELSEQFKTSLQLIASQGLIREFAFSKETVLLKPELLDAYASALIEAVDNEPGGLGCILEEEVQEGKFFIPEKDRVKDRKQNKLLLLAMISDLLSYEIAFRDKDGNEDKTYLVFPSQVAQGNSPLSEPEGKKLIFSFEGPIQNIYARLVVRLAHSDLFRKEKLWKNIAIYSHTHISSDGETKVGMYGVMLRDSGEGHGELILFFDNNTRKKMRSIFETSVSEYLKQNKVLNLLQRCIYTCPVCNETFTESAVQHRKERGFHKIRCSVCEEYRSIRDEEEPTDEVYKAVDSMKNAANARRKQEIDKSKLRCISQDKISRREFDVFLSYNGKDKIDVKKIYKQLRDKGIAPWLDEEEVPPGRSWIELVQKQMKNIKTAAAFVGEKGVGPWQRKEINALLQKFVNEGSPVIPVILAGALREPEIPLFLEEMTRVDFRTQGLTKVQDSGTQAEGKQRDPILKKDSKLEQSLDDLGQAFEYGDESDFDSDDPIDRLIWGITGDRNYVEHLLSSL